MRAYLLIDTESGKEKEINEKISELSNVEETYRVHGTMDIVACVSCPFDNYSATKQLVGRIEGVRNIMDIVTRTEDVRTISSLV